MALRVGEERDRRLGGDLGQRHNHAAARLLDLAQGRLRIVGADVEGHVPVATVLRWPDAGGHLALAQEPVAAGVVRVQLPAEHVAVELLELGAVLAGHLDVDDRSCHGIALLQGCL